MKQLTLDDVNWQNFYLQDLFPNLEVGKSKGLNHLKKQGDGISYLGATNLNNAVLDFVEPVPGMIQKGNCIAFIRNGEGSMGYAVYKQEDFIATSDISLGYNDHLNKYNAMFITTIADRVRGKYNFGYKRSAQRLAKEILTLPAMADGTPDWFFMEQYMRQKEQQILQPTIERLCKHLIFNELIDRGEILYPNWKEFAIGDFFNATRPTARKEDDYPNGDTMFVASGGVNNGITKFCRLKDNEILDKGNCLTISPIDGSCYYQATDFLGRGGAGSSIILLYAKNFTLNRFNGLFISRCISKTASAKYSYGHMASIDRVMRDKIFLPATADGKPDFVFMSSFMQQIEHDIIRTTLPILQSRLKSYNSCWGGVNLDKENWKDFCFTDIFTEIQRGKRLKKADHKDGNMPYVSSTAQDNGVDGFIGNENGIRLFGDCLTLANSGSVGSAFYHRYEFIASDHVTRLKGKNLDKYTYLFMIPLINRLSEKYSFNREINDERIKREKLLLPATTNGTPDWQFMEIYMRNIESRQIALYLSEKMSLYDLPQKEVVQ